MNSDRSRRVRVCSGGIDTQGAISVRGRGGWEQGHGRYQFLQRRRRLWLPPRTDKPQDGQQLMRIRPSVHSAQSNRYPPGRVESFGKGNGVARITDVIVANVGGNEQGLDHPAVFPLALADWNRPPRIASSAEVGAFRQTQIPAAVSSHSRRYSFTIRHPPPKSPSPVDSRFFVATRKTDELSVV